jgi:predicted metal-dependent hydrolase
MPRIIRKKNEEDKLVWRINRRTKEGVYKIHNKFSQAKYCTKVTLKGFENLPSGFYTNDGYGLTAAGTYLLQELYDKFDKKVELTVSSNGPTRLDGRGRTTKAIIQHRKLAQINEAVRAVKRKKNEDIRAEVRNFLAREFNQFRS